MTCPYSLRLRPGPEPPPSEREAFSIPLVPPGETGVHLLQTVVHLLQLPAVHPLTDTDLLPGGASVIDEAELHGAAPARPGHGQGKVGLREVGGRSGFPPLQDGVQGLRQLLQLEGQQAAENLDVPLQGDRDAGELCGVASRVPSTASTSSS